MDEEYIVKTVEYIGKCPFCETLLLKQDEEHNYCPSCNQEIFNILWIEKKYDEKGNII